MYYAEMVINGVLCSRGTPDGHWVPVTKEELTRKYMDLKKEYAAFRELVPTWVENAR